MRKFLFLMFLTVGTVILSQALPSVASTKSASGFDVAGDDAPPLCPVHRVKMVSGSVPVRFGRVTMYEFDDSEEPERSKLVDEYLRAKKEQFPETHRWVNGGCSASFWVGADPSVTLHHCETCRRLEDEWFAKHPDFLKWDRLP